MKKILTLSSIKTKFMAPIRTKVHHSLGGRVRSTFVTEEIPLSPSDKQMITEALGPLKRKNKNSAFWEHADKARNLHYLTLDDVRALIQVIRTSMGNVSQ